ncbi:MAG TPA: lysophospholipid acyltransferase family protein [Phycisphaerales bacterium]|nr:lysophospholipid acyltransferase family protein [Phycisphaerales bacterium]
MPSKWSFQPAADHGLSETERAKSSKREAGLGTLIVSALSMTATRTGLALWHRYSVVGREHLPTQTPFVMVANHASHLDHAALRSALPLRLRVRTHPLAAGDVFFSSTLRAAVATRTINALPMWRKKVGPHALADLRDRLQVGDVGFVLFPEGARTRDGNLMKFKAGIGMLVAGLEVPVIPAWLDGCFRAMPPHTVVPRPRKITARFGAPLRFKETPNTRQGWEHVIAQVEAAVRELRP